MNTHEILQAVKSLNNQQFVELINLLENERQQRARDIQNQANQQIATLTGESKKTRRTMPAKYKHPQTGKTWSGQGRQPRWFLEYLEKGGSENDLLIK